MILLDTDAIIEALDKNSDISKALMIRIIESGEEYCTSSVNMHELLYAIEKYSKDPRLILQIPTQGCCKNDNELSAILEQSAE